MAEWQKSERAGIRHLASQELANDPKSPQHFAIQGINAEGEGWIVKMLGGGLEDSGAMMIVDAASGKFFVQPGISMPGGTDVARP